MSHTSPNDAFLQLFGTPYDRVQVTATAASTLSVSDLADARSALLARRSPGPRLGVTKLSSSSSSLQTSIARWEESVHAFHFDDLDFHHDHDHHQPNATNMMEEVASSSSCCSATAVSEQFRARSASLDFWGMDLSAPMSIHEEGQVYIASSVEPVERHGLVSSVIKSTAPKRKRPSVTTPGEPSNSTSDSSAPKRAWRQPARSCLPCRQKKSRCDRREQCNSCTTRGMQCVWTGVARPLTDEELLAEAEGAVVPAPTAASALTCSSAVAKSVGAAKKAARVATVTPPRLPSAPPVVPTAAVAAHVPASMASTTVPTMVASSPEQVEITRLRSIIKSLAQQLQLDLTTLLEPDFLPEPLIATTVPPPSTEEATTSTTFKKRRRSNLGPLPLPSPPALSYGSSSNSSSSSSSILGQISPELPFVYPTVLPAHQTGPSSTKHARRSSYGFHNPMEVFAGRNEEPSDAWLNPSSWLTAIPKTLMH